MREWLRLRGVAFYQGLPGTGYALSCVAVALVLAATDGEHKLPDARAMHLLFLFFLPASCALWHWLAPCENRGGKPYWALAGAWLGAVVMGALAHWPALDPTTPWFSLARYVLLAAAVFLAVVSLVFGRPCFGPAHPPRRGSGFFRVLAVLESLAVLAILVAIFTLVPYRLALAPRYPGARLQKLFASEDMLAIEHIAWSPDSRTLLAGSALPRQGKLRDISLLSLDGRRNPLARNAYLSLQPWLWDGRGFVFWRRPKPDGPREIWYSSADGREQRVLLRGAGPAHCSPTAPRVAYWQDGWAYVAGPDLASPRRLAQCGGIWGWSPDGSLLLVYPPRRPPSRPRSETDPRYLLVPASGGPPRPLPAQCVSYFPVWLNARELVSQQRAEGRGYLAPFTDTTKVAVWSTEGQCLRAHSYRTGLSISFGGPWPPPDGRRIAAMLGQVAPLSDRLYLLDTVTGRPLSLPSSGVVTDAAWSPDGKKLAFIGSEYHPGDDDSGSYSTSYLGLVTGL